MIISHRHRFIFVHCRKAAGSSVAVSLSRYLGPDDLQFSAIPETLESGLRVPRRVVREAFAASPLSLTFLFPRRARFAKKLSSVLKQRYSSVIGRSVSHPPASAIAAAFPAEWANYSKFCIVRNPWAKTLSDYHWRTRTVAAPPTFEQYVSALEAGEDLNGIVPENHDNWPLYTIGGEIAVDRVFRFENLAEELAVGLKDLGLPWDGWLPHAKKGQGGGAKSAHYRDAYTDRLAGIVAELYRKEIDAFGYKF